MLLPSMTISFFSIAGSPVISRTPERPDTRYRAGAQGMFHPVDRSIPPSSGNYNPEPDRLSIEPLFLFCHTLNPSPESADDDNAYAFREDTVFWI